MQNSIIYNLPYSKSFVNENNNPQTVNINSNILYKYTLNDPNDFVNPFSNIFSENMFLLDMEEGC